MDEYIAGFSKNEQGILEKVRATVKKAVPAAKETISYKIPTFTLNGTYLIYFAGYKKHIGLYPVPMGKTEFQKELSIYSSGKGTAKFPLEQAMPLALIRKIAKYRMKEVLAKTAEKKKKK